jgi:hypothetical protein
VTHRGKGEFAFFSGPNSITEEDTRKIFRRDKFLQTQNPTSLSKAQCGLGRHRAKLTWTSGETQPQTYDDCRYPESSLQFEDQWAPQPKRRKRPRASETQRRGLDDDEPRVITTAKRALVIGDAEAVREFYNQRFRCLQQTACKIIAKHIIKVIAPKKQANNPYTKRDAAAPAWWPKPWGTGEKDKVRHVEPDHQWKKGWCSSRVRVFSLFACLTSEQSAFIS